MPRLFGLRERLHQPLWDHAFRSNGPPVPPVQPKTTLFGNANTGSFPLTNLDIPGQLASDSTYVILAIRVCMFFDCALDCSEPGQGDSDIDASVGGL